MEMTSPDSTFHSKTVLCQEEPTDFRHSPYSAVMKKNFDILQLRRVHLLCNYFPMVARGKLLACNALVGEL